MENTTAPRRGAKRSTMRARQANNRWLEFRLESTAVIAPGCESFARWNHSEGFAVDIIWDGITRTETLSESAAQIRHVLANAAKNYNWHQVFDLITGHKELINTTRPGGSSLYAPLHQAAHGGASIDVVQRLIEMNAWRSLQNARGERPVDVAERRGHLQLLEVLTPEYRHTVPLGVLLKIQSHFHSVIRDRAERLVDEHALRLPELEPLLELDRPRMWFPVPGMHGGFSYHLESAGVEAKLISESWCRVVDGSGQRHEITSAGSQLVEEGFV